MRLRLWRNAATLAGPADRRRAYESAVEEYQSRSPSKLTPLVWRRDIPVVDSWPQFARTVRLPEPPAAWVPTS